MLNRIVSGFISLSNHFNIQSFGYKLLKREVVIVTLVIAILAALVIICIHKMNSLYVDNMNSLKRRSVRRVDESDKQTLPHQNSQQASPQLSVSVSAPIDTASEEKEVEGDLNKNDLINSSVEPVKSTVELVVEANTNHNVSMIKRDDRDDNVMPNHFLLIPEEVIEKIFSFLSEKELAILSPMSKRMNLSAENKVLWRQLCHRKNIGLLKDRPVEGEIDWKKVFQNACFYFSDEEVAPFFGQVSITVVIFDNRTAEDKIPLGSASMIDCNLTTTIYHLKQLICHHFHLPKKQMNHIAILNGGLRIKGDHLRAREVLNSQTLFHVLIEVD